MTEMSEESSKKAEELGKTAKELQKLLTEASDQYQDLERRSAINETTYKEHLAQKNETIAALKKELSDANNLIDSLKQGFLFALTNAEVCLFFNKKVIGTYLSVL